MSDTDAVEDVARVITRKKVVNMAFIASDGEISIPTTFRGVIDPEWKEGYGTKSMHLRLDYLRLFSFERL